MYCAAVCERGRGDILTSRLRPVGPCRLFIISAILDAFGVAGIPRKSNLRLRLGKEKFGLNYLVKGVSERFNKTAKY